MISIPVIKKNSKIFGIFKVSVLIFMLSFSTVSAKVQVTILDGDPPTIDYSTIDPAVKITTASQCLGKDYSATAEKNALKCALGKIDASILNLRMIDTHSSLDRINLMLRSLDTTEKYVEDSKTKNSYELIAIPAGLMSKKVYQKAESSTLGLMCLKDASGNLLGTNVLVGVVADSTAVAGSFFDTVPKSQLDIISKAKSDTVDLQKRALALATVKKWGILDTAEAAAMASSIKGVQQTLAKVTIPVTVSDFQKNYADLVSKTQATIASSVTLKTDKDGNRTSPAWASDKTTQFFLKKAGVNPPVLNDAIVKIDSSTFDFPNMVMPHSYAIDQVKSAIGQHRTRLTTLKPNLEKTLKELKASYETLKNNNYNCI